jgi:hypothetical protein
VGVVGRDDTYRSCLMDFTYGLDGSSSVSVSNECPSPAWPIISKAVRAIHCTISICCESKVRNKPSK